MKGYVVERIGALQMPERIQRTRARGWRMPDNTVYVGRPTKWGNPYRPVHLPNGTWVPECNYGMRYPGFGPNADGSFNTYRGALLECVRLYEEVEVTYHLNEDEAIDELGGKNLACWCPLNQPCHADLLLEFANPK